MKIEDKINELHYYVCMLEEPEWESYAVRLISRLQLINDKNLQSLNFSSVNNYLLVSLVKFKAICKNDILEDNQLLGLKRLEREEIQKAEELVRAYEWERIRPHDEVLDSLDKPKGIILHETSTKMDYGEPANIWSFELDWDARTRSHCIILKYGAGRKAAFTVAEEMCAYQPLSIALQGIIKALNSEYMRPSLEVEDNLRQWISSLEEELEQVKSANKETIFYMDEYQKARDELYKVRKELTAAKEELEEVKKERDIAVERSESLSEASVWVDKVISLGGDLSLRESTTEAEMMKRALVALEEAKMSQQGAIDDSSWDEF